MLRRKVFHTVILVKAQSPVVWVPRNVGHGERHVSWKTEVEPSLPGKTPRADQRAVSASAGSVLAALRAGTNAPSTEKRTAKPMASPTSLGEKTK